MIKRHLRFLKRKRKNTAGAEQQRQKDTSEKRGHVKPVHPCTGLTTRFADGKTWLLCRTTAIHGGSDAADALRCAKASDVINYTNNTHVITDYRYDSFGRRIHTAERTKSGMRTIYDGLSFEVVKEAETFLGTRGITSSATGEAKVYFKRYKWYRLKTRRVC